MSYQARWATAERLVEKAEGWFYFAEDPLSDLVEAYREATTGLQILATDDGLDAEEIAELEELLLRDQRKIEGQKRHALKKLRQLQELIEALPLPE